MGWVHAEGVTQKYHGCVNGKNVAPLINETTNYNGQPTPGPVNMYTTP